MHVDDECHYIHAHSAVNVQAYIDVRKEAVPQCLGNVHSHHYIGNPTAAVVYRDVLYSPT